MRYKQRKISGRKVDEHRLVMERAIGRQLSTGEHVHHKNGNKLDNAPSNLEIMSPVDHGRLHHLKHPIHKTCAICAVQFTPHKTKRKRQQTCNRYCQAILTGRKLRKLSDADYAQIISRRQGGEKLLSIAKDFSISVARVSGIYHGKSLLAFTTSCQPPRPSPGASSSKS